MSEALQTSAISAGEDLADVLSNSRMKTARRCLRLHDLQYQQGYRPAFEPEELRFGSLWHLCQEEWWRAAQHKDADERLDVALDAIPADTDPFDRVRVEVLMAGYHTRWAEEPYEVLGVEQRFIGPMVNPRTGNESRIWRRGGRLDVVVRDLRDGLVRVMDHKTSGEDIRQGTEFWRRLRMDTQISGYFEGARILGYDVVGWIHDVVAKPQIKPLEATPEDQRKYTKATKTEPSRLYANQRDHDETVDEFRGRLGAAVEADFDAASSEYFQRAEIVRLEKELHEAMLDDWKFGTLLRGVIRDGYAPRNPDACRSFGRTCAFFDVCSGAASLDDPLRFKRLPVTHPELVEREEQHT